MTISRVYVAALSSKNTCCGQLYGMGIVIIANSLVCCCALGALCFISCWLDTLCFHDAGLGEAQARKTVACKTLAESLWLVRRWLESFTLGGLLLLRCWRGSHRRESRWLGSLSLESLLAVGLIASGLYLPKNTFSNYTREILSFHRIISPSPQITHHSRNSSYLSFFQLPLRLARLHR